MYKDAAVKKYLDDLAARMPAPGGGSAAALTAALGASLISMVVNFTSGKPKYSRYEAELKGILQKSESLRREFLGLIDLDVTAYRSGNRRDALDVPFMLARLCFEAIKLCPPLIKKGNPGLISDVATAAVMLEAAFAAAVYNVRINLASIADRKLSAGISRELARKDRMIKKLREQTEVKVGEIIGR